MTALAIVVAPEAADELSALLLRRTVEVARTAAPRVDRVVGESTASGALRAAEQAFAAGAAPVVVLAPDCAMLTPTLVRSAFEDLADGCDLVVGPAPGGGHYLLGLARPLPDLGSVELDAWENADVMTLAFAASEKAGLTIALLRPERRLTTPSDRQAARIDPLVPPEVRELLG